MTNESKRIAWTAVLADKAKDGMHYSLGLATEGEYGYSPIKETGDAADPLFVANGPTRFKTYDEASAEADRRNEALHLSPRDATIIVASTMTRR